MNMLNRGFTQLNDDDLYHRATAIVAGVGANAKFAALAASLPPISAAAAALNKASTLPGGAVREQSVLGERTALVPLLQNLADALEIVPGVTAVDLAGTGYELRQSNHHTSLPPDMPTGLHLKYPGISGQLQVLLSAVARAMFYEVEYTLDPVNGPWTDVPAFGSTRGIVLTGLTRGKDYYVRVRAVAAGQNRGPWSDIATTMAM